MSGFLRSADAALYDGSGRLVNIYRITTENTGSSYTDNVKFFYDPSGVAGCMYTSGGSTTTYHFTKNIFGDIVCVRDSSNNVVGTYTYDAYGNCTILSGTASNLSLASTPGVASKIVAAILAVIAIIIQ